jgi:hypothetical protein
MLAYLSSSTIGFAVVRAGGCVLHPLAGCVADRRRSVLRWTGEGTKPLVAAGGRPY